MKRFFCVVVLGTAMLPATASAFCVSVGWGINAFTKCKSGDGHHESITRGALGSFFATKQLDEIVEGIRCRDMTEETDLVCSSYGNQWGKVESYHPMYHFDNCALESGFTDLRSWYGAVLREIQKGTSAGAGAARRVFGFLLLHRIQDFFSHSNWINLAEHHAIFPQLGRPILWFHQAALLGLLRKGRLVTGLHKNPKEVLGTDYCKAYAGPRYGHDDLNKDRPGSPEGARIYAGKQTRFLKAYELASQETHAWWGMIRSDICRLQGKARGAALLTTTTGRSATCP